MATDWVGARGFEPPTPRSRTECSTRLSHAPTGELLSDLLATQDVTRSEKLSYLSFRLD